MLSLDQASAIVDAALRHGDALGCAPLTVAVLDPGGHLLALKHQDGSGILRPQIARAKAWGALDMGAGSRELFERAGAAAGFIAALTSVSNGRLVPVPGGVLIRDADGGVGISGDHPDRDEACAVFAIEHGGFVADPGAGHDQPAR